MGGGLPALHLSSNSIVVFVVKKLLRVCVHWRETGKEQEQLEKEEEGLVKSNTRQASLQQQLTEERAKRMELERVNAKLEEALYGALKKKNPYKVSKSASPQEKLHALQSLIQQKEQEILGGLKTKNDQLIKAMQAIDHHRKKYNEELKELEDKKSKNEQSNKAATDQFYEKQSIFRSRRGEQKEI